MRYYLLVTGRGKNRRIVEYWIDRELAIKSINIHVLDLGDSDLRIITTLIEPPTHLRGFHYVVEKI